MAWTIRKTLLVVNITLSVLVMAMHSAAASPTHASKGAGDESFVPADSYPFSCDMTPSEHQQATNKALQALENDGFKVEAGKLIYEHSTRFAANPSTLYGLFHFVNPIPVFTLDKSDAVFFMGCTPPPMRYFGFTPYVASSPELNKTLVMASLQDSINSMTMKTTTSSPIAPFSSTSLIIMTGSQTTDAAVRKAFADSVPPTAHNTFLVSDQLVKFGSGPLSASALIAMARVNLYDNITECDLYTNTTFPIYKVSRAYRDDPMFPTPERKSRYSGKTEDFLSARLAKLVLAVVREGTSSGFQLAYEGRIEPYPLNPLECIADGINCLGDCPDAAYFANPTNFTFGSQHSTDYYMVVGVNHYEIGVATYSNFAIDSSAAVTDVKFGNSSSKYLPDEPGINDFFAYKVARTCAAGESYCLEVSVDEVPPTKVVNFISRVYLNTETGTGPAYNETLTNYVLHFART